MSSARRLRCLGIALVCLGIACASPPGDGERQDEIDPDQLSWAGPVDYTDLRTKYGERDDFSTLCERGSPLRDMAMAVQGEDWDRVLEVSAPYLVDCPVDIDAHYLRAIACEQVGRSIDAYHHGSWYRGLVDSVLSSGTGEREDPFVVISVGEEYAVLRALQLEPESQRLVADGIDAITARDADGESVTIFFRPEAHWRRLEKAFANPDG